MRTIGVVTTSRADFGIYRPVLRAIQSHPRLNLRLFVSGSHLSTHGTRTAWEIEQEGFEITDRVEILLCSDTPQGTAKSMGLATAGFAQVFEGCRPDLLLVLGDRFEMFGAALAAVPFGIPIGHIHGGELTEGAFDESLRHALTKLSHLHFVATQEYARRVRQLGESPWRIVVSGAPALDNLREVVPMSLDELERERGVRVTADTLLVTFHPTTLEQEDVREQTTELLSALEAMGLPVVFTMPNADPGGLVIRQQVNEFVRHHATATAAESLGTRGYFAAMRSCAALVGNSSSAILEAPSFELPAVNVGNRQRGRVRGTNVIDVVCRRDAILSAITRALDPGFRASLRGRPNPYGDGRAASKIVQCLDEVSLGGDLLVKEFHDVPPGVL